MHPSRNAALAAIAAALPLLPAAAAVRGGVFDDVKIWYKGSAGNAVGTADTGSTTPIKNLAKLGDASDSSHGGSYYWWGWRLSYENDAVSCPYAGVTLPSTPCLVVRSPVTTNSIETVTIGGVEQEQPNVTYRTGALQLKTWFADKTEACENYTVVLRFRNEAINPMPGTQNRPLNLGAVWTGSAGYAAGIDFRMTPADVLSEYSVPRFVVGNNQSAEYKDIRIKDGTWVDCAIAVSGSTLTTTFCYDEDGVPKLVRNSKTYTTTGPQPSVAANATVLIGGNNTASCTFTRGVGMASGSSWTYGFRGAFHQIAFWDRTLSDDEIREAMAGGTGRPGLVNVGIEGNGTAEFAASPSKTAVATDGDWENLNPALTEANPSATISFDCPALRAGMPQWLRVAGAEGSSGRVAVALNGETLGDVAVPSGAAGSLFVPEGKVAGGANTLVLTRLSGAPTLDAVTLGGSWKFGEDINSFATTAEGATLGPDKFVFHPAGGNDKFHSRGTNAAEGSRETYFDFFVPADMVGKFRGVFSTRAQNTGGNAQAYTFHANGALVGDYTLLTRTVTEVKIPETAIVAGWNRLYWKTTGNGYWANIDWHRFSLLPAPEPLVLVVR